MISRSRAEKRSRSLFSPPRRLPTWRTRPTPTSRKDYEIPISGPILTLGLLASLAGNAAPALAYPLNAANGFLVTTLEGVARAACALPFATITTPGVTTPLVGLFYAGCVPALLADGVFPEERRPLWAALLVLWTVLWLALVGAGSI